MGIQAVPLRRRVPRRVAVLTVAAVAMALAGIVAADVGAQVSASHHSVASLADGRTDVIKVP